MSLSLSQLIEFCKNWEKEQPPTGILLFWQYFFRYIWETNYLLNFFGCLYIIHQNLVHFVENRRRNNLSKFKPSFHNLVIVHCLWHKDLKALECLRNWFKCARSLSLKWRNIIIKKRNIIMKKRNIITKKRNIIMKKRSIIMKRGNIITKNRNIILAVKEYYHEKDWI